MTERKRAEAQFRGLLESASDAMVIIDQQGQIVVVNAQAETLFAYKREEMLGQAIEIRFDPAHASLLFGAFRRLPATAEFPGTEWDWLWYNELFTGTEAGCGPIAPSQRSPDYQLLGGVSLRLSGPESENQILKGDPE